MMNHCIIKRHIVIDQGDHCQWRYEIHASTTRIPKLQNIKVWITWTRILKAYCLFLTSWKNHFMRTWCIEIMFCIITRTTIGTLLAKVPFYFQVSCCKILTMVVPWVHHKVSIYPYIITTVLHPQGTATVTRPIGY